MKMNEFWKRFCSFLMAIAIMLSVVSFQTHVHAEQEFRRIYVKLASSEMWMEFYDENGNTLDCAKVEQDGVLIYDVPVTAKRYEIRKDHAGGGDMINYPELPAEVDTYIDSDGWSCQHRIGYVDSICGTCGEPCVHTTDAEVCANCQLPMQVKVDGVYYPDFLSALSVWQSNGGTLTLLDDVTYSKTNSINLTDDKVWVLDLNDKALTIQDYYLIQQKAGKLTVKNGTLNSQISAKGSSQKIELNKVSVQADGKGYAVKIVEVPSADITDCTLMAENPLCVENTNVNIYGNTTFHRSENEWDVESYKGGTITFYTLPTQQLALRANAAGPIVYGGENVELTTDMFISVSPSYIVAKNGDGSIGLVACDHSGTACYTYKNAGYHNVSCEICHIQDRSYPEAVEPHTVENDVCIRCGGRTIYVDATFLGDVSFYASRLHVVDDSNTRLEMKTISDGFFSALIPADFNGEVWWEGIEYEGSCNTTVTQVPKDKNCMRLYEYDYSTCTYNMVWCNYPHECSFSSQTGLCTQCMKECSHLEWENGVCKACQYACRHLYHDGEHKCCECAVQLEHTFDKYGFCEGNYCYQYCSHSSLDENEYCNDCGMKKIYFFVAEAYSGVVEIYFKEKYTARPMTYQDDGTYVGYTTIGAKMCFDLLEWRNKYGEEYSDYFIYDGTYNAFRETGNGSNGKVELLMFNYPCLEHSYTSENGICPNCGEACKHLKHTAEGCAECGAVDASAMHGNYVYSVSEDGATLTKYCGVDTCSAVVAQTTVNAPAHTVYGDDKEPKVTLTAGENTIVSNDAVYYELQDGSWVLLNAVPTDAGNYKAEINVDSYTLYVEYTVAKINSAVTAPEGMNDLVYNGKSFGLIATEASTADGIVKYRVNHESAWVDAVPEQVWDAGTYTIWYKVFGDLNHNDVEEASITVTVAPADLNEISTMISLRDADSLIFDGTAWTPEVSIMAAPDQPAETEVLWGAVELVENQDYTVTYTNNRYAGEATITITGMGNYTGKIEHTFDIAAAELSALAKPEGTLTYTGEAQTVNVLTSSNVRGGEIVTFTYSTEENGIYGAMPTFTDAGVYTVYYKASAESHKDCFGSFDVTIEKAPNSWISEPNIQSWVYGDEAASPNAEAKFGQWSVRYVGNACDGTIWDSNEMPTKAGDYLAVLSVPETTNYIGLSSAAFFEIEKAVCDMSGVTWDYNTAIVYDGMDHMVAINEETLPEGAFISTYTGHTASAIGIYQATATIEYDDNHTGVATLMTDWRIADNWTPIEYVVSEVNEYGWHNADVVITPADGYLISWTDINESAWGDFLTASVEGADSSITFYLKNKATGDISLAGKENYKLDKAAPTGSAALNDRTATDSLSSEIRFDLYYNEEVVIQIQAEDENSGVAAIEYILSKTALTEEELDKVEKWDDYNGSFGVEVEDGKQFVCYIRITDLAGNVTYLSSEGAEYDTTAPVIEGVTDGATYYTTQEFFVNEKNVETISLNGYAGRPDGDRYLLEGDKNTEYLIVVVDKAGNTTEISVKMAPISDIADAVDDLTAENVTSDDRVDLEIIVEKANELLQDTNLTEAEKEKLEEVKAQANALITAIEDAICAVDTEEVEKVLEITDENVKMSDKADLETAKADLEKALDNYDSNYTEDEKNAIVELLKQIEDALVIVESVGTAEAAVKALTADFEPDELDKVEEVLAAKAIYNALSDYEKSLVSVQVKQKLDTLVASLTDYAIISGEDGVWAQDTQGTLTIVANGAFSKFAGIMVDGKIVDASHYEVKAGSTIVTLKDAYLQTLSEGEHTITILFTDGDITGGFKIVEDAKSEESQTEESKPGDSKPEESEPEESKPEDSKPTDSNSAAPDTGDSSMPVMWATVLMISGCVVYALLVDRKKAYRKTK